MLGNNIDGELGLADTIYQTTPVAVTGLSSGASVLAQGPDALHQCAIVGAAAKCWGFNQTGQLGNGVTVDSSVPVAVNRLSSGVSAIADGANHSCAIAGGKAMCWGSNSNGQLGNGTIVDAHAPVTAIGSNAIAIATGKAHSCAILSGGTVKCWGSNLNGELGDGTITDRHAPVSVLGLSAAAVAISAGALHTCAVLNNGKIQCWGFNGNGQLGNGTTVRTGVNPPVMVSNISSGATAIANGDAHSCALVAGGIQCWGAAHQDSSATARRPTASCRSARADSAAVSLRCSADSTTPAPSRREPRIAGATRTTSATIQEPCKPFRQRCRSATR